MDEKNKIPTNKMTKPILYDVIYLIIGIMPKRW